MKALVTGRSWLIMLISVILVSIRVVAQRCAAALPVGETGVSKVQGGRGGGGSPGLHEPGPGPGRKVGDTALAGTGLAGAHPGRREGEHP